MSRAVLMCFSHFIFNSSMISIKRYVKIKYFSERFFFFFFRCPGRESSKEQDVKSKLSIWKVLCRFNINMFGFSMYMIIIWSMFLKRKRIELTEKRLRKALMRLMSIVYHVNVLPNTRLILFLIGILHFLLQRFFSCFKQCPIY